MRLLRSHLRALRRARRDGEGGYVFVTLALTMVILLLFAGFSVDVGSWYARASKIQRAADAAALAGVVWMPDFDKATAEAKKALQHNGFDPDTDTSITWAPSRIPGNDHQLAVSVTDNDVDRFFSGMVIKNQTLTRSSTAEYAMPVPLGSPDNTLGNQFNGDSKYLWASVSGPNTDKINGDPFMTKCGVGESTTGCTGNTGNGGEYDNVNHYIYTIDVPSTMVNKVLNLEIFDAGNYPRSNYANVETADNGTVNTEFELFNPPGNALDTQSYLTDSTFNSGSCQYGTTGKWDIDNNTSSATYMNTWASLCKVTVTRAGQYHLRVRSYGTGSGWNQFSLKANLYSTCSPSCTGLQSTTPSLYGYNALSLFNNLPGQSGNLSATFYLAKIDPIHAGKHMVIELFDPGDGQSGTYYVNILKPGDTTVSTINCSYGLSTATSLTGASPCQILTRNSGGNTYNGKWLKIDISIPSTYTCSSDCWWKVKYDFTGVSSGASPNDRTVWTAQIIGDPVHLVKAS